MPSGTVERQNNVDIRWSGRGELIEEDLHRLGVDSGKHQGDILTGGRANCGENVGPFVAELLDTRRAFATSPPAMAEPALVADTSFIFEPQFYPLAGMGCDGCSYLIGKPPFLKAACASRSRFGWYGRAFWREKPNRRSTRVMLDGW